MFYWRDRPATQRLRTARALSVCWTAGRCLKRWPTIQTTQRLRLMPCEAKRQYLLTLQVSRYCLLPSLSIKYAGWEHITHSSLHTSLITMWRHKPHQHHSHKSKHLSGAMLIFTPFRSQSIYLTINPWEDAEDHVACTRNHTRGSISCFYFSARHIYPSNTRHWTNIAVLLGQRRRHTFLGHTSNLWNYHKNGWIMLDSQSMKFSNSEEVHFSK